MPITKGPWYVDEAGDVCWERGLIAIICGKNYGEWRDHEDDGEAEFAANAQAIAALPELVEALLPFAVMADVADEYGQKAGSTCEWRMSYDDFARARALLARLEGEHA